jgi:bacteriocin biosynthesis cyclodehydratase domain-containing protein
MRIGNMPPRGIEIEDAPEELDELIRVLSAPTTIETAAQALDGMADVPAAGWAEVIGQLVEAGVVGEAIPQESRYARHLLYYDLQGIDPTAAQAHLSDATVAVVGAGGIGGNVASLLAGAGIGQILLTDGDTVDLSNLTRQFLYHEGALGRLKVEIGAERLAQINSEVRVSTIDSAASRELFLNDLADCDVVVVSADEPDAIHEWVDEGAREHGYAYLAASYIEGHGSIGPLVLPGSTACFDCMKRDAENLDSVEAVRAVAKGEGYTANLNGGHQAPSFGPLNQLVAALAANEIVRLLVGLRCETAGRRVLVDSRDYSLTKEEMERDPACPSCSGLKPHRFERTAVDAGSMEDLYESSRETDSLNTLLLDDFLIDLVSPSRGRRVFDFGCGNGVQALRLAKANASVFAFDPSEGMRTQFREAMAAAGAAIVLADDLLDPAIDKVYDAILATNVFDLLSPEELDEALAWITSHLARDGMVIATVPHPIKDGAIWTRESSEHGWEYRDLRLREYFLEGPVTKHWADSDGQTVVRALRSFHRTIESYSEAFGRGGLECSRIFEPRPSRSLESDFPDVWARTHRIPYFLTFVLRRARQSTTSRDGR